MSGTHTITIPANGVGNDFTPNDVPVGFTGSAIISATQPIVGTVNERGAAGSGTFVALSGGSNRVGLPAVANGFAGFTTGTTILNLSNQPARITLQYYNPDGTPSSVPGLVYNVQPYASVLAFQGGGQAALPANFFGTAVVTSNVGPVVVTTNAAQPGLFYTYSEPAQ